MQSVILIVVCVIILNAMIGTARRGIVIKACGWLRRSTDPWRCDIDRTRRGEAVARTVILQVVVVVVLALFEKSIICCYFSSPTKEDVDDDINDVVSNGRSESYK